MKADRYALKRNLFFVYDVFANLPKNYRKSKDIEFPTPSSLWYLGVIVFKGRPEGLPLPDDWDVDPDAIYVHYTNQESEYSLYCVAPDDLVVVSYFFFAIIEKNVIGHEFVKIDPNTNMTSLFLN